MSELGNVLRQARLDKGYTLNDLQQITKIQTKYLNAIEEGTYDKIPSEFYLRAFIKQYADSVGLDGDGLLEEHQFEIKDFSGDGDSSDSPYPSRADRFSETDQTDKIEVMRKYLPTVALVAAILVIILSLMTAINRLGKTEDSPVVSNTETTSVVSSVEPSEYSEVAEEESLAEIESAEETIDLELAEGELQVGDQRLILIDSEVDKLTYELDGEFSDYLFEVDGLGTVWFGVFEDGLIVFDDVIADKDTIEIVVSPETESLLIEVGYVEGVEVYVNDIYVPLDGHLIEFVLPSNADQEVDEASLDDLLSETDEEVEDEDAAVEDEDSDTEEETYQGPAVLDPSRRQ